MIFVCILLFNKISAKLIKTFAIVLCFLFHRFDQKTYEKSQFYPIFKKFEFKAIGKPLMIK